MNSRTERKKRIAPESIKTKRARDKLRKQWEEQDLLITESALADMIDKIQEWIAANATHRVTLRKKTIRLFDQNQNAAVLSKKVQQFAQKIREDMSHLANVSQPVD